MIGRYFLNKFYKNKIYNYKTQEKVCLNSHLIDSLNLIDSEYHKINYHIISSKHITNIWSGITNVSHYLDVFIHRVLALLTNDYLTRMEIRIELNQLITIITEFHLFDINIDFNEKINIPKSYKNAKYLKTSFKKSGTYFYLLKKGLDSGLKMSDRARDLSYNDLTIFTFRNYTDSVTKYFISIIDVLRSNLSLKDKIMILNYMRFANKLVIETLKPLILEQENDKYESVNQ